MQLPILDILCIIILKPAPCKQGTIVSPRAALTYGTIPRKYDQYVPAATAYNRTGKRMPFINRHAVRAAATLAILCCCGCAALLPGALGEASTLISLGSLGQTAIKVTYAVLEEKKT